jgi:hypothetical protein
MNVLFLDIDGVMISSLDLNPEQIETPFGMKDKFREECVIALNQIWLQVNYCLVISSDRTVNNIPSISNFKDYLLANGVIAPLIGFTKKSSKANSLYLEETRENEIMEWVNTHNPKRWCAVDDYNLKGLRPNFVHCADDDLGISVVKNDIIEILKRN